MTLICLHDVDLVFAFEITYKAEVKITFTRHVKAWGHQFVTVLRISVFNSG